MVLGCHKRFKGLAQGPEAGMSGEMEFSVILPVCHGGDFLQNALASLRTMEFPPELFEVLVAGSAGDTESRRIVEAESPAVKFRISYVGTANPGRSSKMNAASSVSRGRVLVFADDDCIFPPDWLRRFSGVLDHEPDVGIIGGRDEPGHDGTPFNVALDCVLNSFLGTGGLRRGGGIKVGKYYPKLWNMAVPREVAFNVAARSKEGLKIFNESLVVHEDVDLAERIEESGKRIVFAPEMRVGHCRDTTFLRFVRRNVKMAATSRALGIHRLPHTALAVFALGTPLLALASVLLPPLRIVVLIITGTYAAVLLASVVGWSGRIRSIRVLAIIMGLLVSVHLARGVGYLLARPKGMMSNSARRV